MASKESNPSSTDEVLALCERLIEGTLSPDEKQRLEAIVLSDPDARRTYVDYMSLNAALRARGGAPAEDPRALAAAPAAGQAGAPVAGRRARSPRVRAISAVAAAALALVVGAFAGQRLLEPREAGVVARLSQTRGCRWDESSLPTTPGASLRAGRLRLAEGLATLTFASGAEVILEGPAELELVSPLACLLHRGSIVARVPQKAKGFTVRSATATLIDHGTEFGVTADVAGRTRVDVLSGLVEARHARTGETLRLETGEAALLDGASATRGRFAADPEPALHPNIARAPAGELVITTAAGRGRTAFVQGRPPTPERRPGPGMLLVKNCLDEGWQRKTYLAFDTSALGGRAIADATLSLALVPTGYGHAAFVPDATFSVYGVTDDALDAWSPETVDWRDAPANRAGAAAVDTDRAVRIGSFVVPQGAASGVFSVGGRALAELLGRDRNGVVTFILVRDTIETRSSGLVHGFAGNHHPTAPPPSLRVTLAAAGGGRPQAPPAQRP